MKPTPRQLEAFCTVDTHESMVDAARAHGCDLSTLSKHRSELTALIGTRLYERDHTGFRLTRHGRILYAALERGRDLRDAALAEIAAEVTPTLQFVAAEVVTQHYLPGIAWQLERQHPNLRCSTDSGPEEHIRRMLQDGRREPRDRAAPRGVARVSLGPPDRSAARADLPGEIAGADGGRAVGEGGSATRCSGCRRRATP